MKHLKIKIILLFIIVFALLVCPEVAFAEESTGGEIQSVQICYQEQSTVEYALQCNLPGLAELMWQNDIPGGISWSYSSSEGKLILSLDWTCFKKCGYYPFVLKVGEYQSEVLALTVLPQSVELPAEVNSFIYNGEEHCAVSNIDDRIIYSGVTCAVNAGDYVAFASLADPVNYAWENGSSAPVCIPWTISPAELKISGVKALSKYCDGTDEAEFDTADAVIDGLVEGDDVSCLVSGHFSNPKVGSGKTVEYTVSLGGEDGTNYFVSNENNAPLRAAIYKSKDTGEVEFIPDSSYNYRCFTVIGSEDELIEAALDTEQWQLIEGGADIKLWFSAVDISENPPLNDKEQVMEAIGDSIVAAYMDLNMLCSVGDGEITEKIPELNREVEISFEIPKSLLNKNIAVNRSFSLIRVHDGEAQKLDLNYVPGDKQLSFCTDKFSTYALVYKDDPVEGFVNPITVNDGNYTVLYAILASIILFIVARIVVGAVYRKYEENAYVGKHSH